jgi:tetratricopeptide (TPR) repeat protein
MLQARLATLDGDARRVLRAASVFGVRFWGGAVGRLLGRADAPDATLEHLAEQEFIELLSERDVPSEWTWRFRQDLTREAAYATLTSEDRRLGHQLAGEWLVQQAIDDPLTLAGHHLGADEPVRAAEALALAAEEALDAGDHHAALKHVQQASPLLDGVGEPSAGTAARLQLTAAEAQRWLGAYPASLASASAALDALDAGQEGFFRALGCCIVAAGQTGASDALDAALARIQRTPARDHAAALYRLIGLCRGAHQRLGQRRLPDADALLALAQQLANELADDQGAERPVVAAWLHTTFAARAHVAGDWPGYLRGSERAVQAYDQARDLRHACNQRVRLGYGLVEVADFEGAVGVLRRAVDDAAALGVPLIEGFALQNLGLAQLRAGDLALAHATLRNAEARGAQHGHQSVVAGACYYLTDVLLARGDVDAAARCAAEAAAGFAGSPFHRSLALAAQARVLLAQGDVGKAQELAERAAGDRIAVAFAESSDAVVDVTLADARRATGDHQGARRATREGAERLAIYLAAIPDDAMRERMRTRIPAHAALLQGS